MVVAVVVVVAMALAVPVPMPPWPWPSLLTREERAFEAAARVAGQDWCRPEHGPELLMAAATWATLAVPEPVDAGGADFGTAARAAGQDRYQQEHGPEPLTGGSNVKQNNLKLNCKLTDTISEITCFLTFDSFTFC